MDHCRTLVVAAAVALLAACQGQKPAEPPARGIPPLSDQRGPKPAGQAPAQTTAAAAPAGTPAVFATAPAPGTKARCAVTGEEFTVDAKTTSATHEGKTYVFCCDDCKPTFEKNPTKYAAK